MYNQYWWEEPQINEEPTLNATNSPRNATTPASAATPTWTSPLSSRSLLAKCLREVIVRRGSEWIDGLGIQTCMKASEPLPRRKSWVSGLTWRKFYTGCTIFTAKSIDSLFHACRWEEPVGVWGLQKEGPGWERPENRRIASSPFPSAQTNRFRLQHRRGGVTLWGGGEVLFERSDNLAATKEAKQSHGIPWVPLLRRPW